jgi:hypothetical protein
MFITELSWRKFIFSLPRERACDMIDRTWTQQLDQGEDTPEYVTEDHPSVSGDGGPFKLFTAMDITALLNRGDVSIVVHDAMNYRPQSGTSSVYYALRDIKKWEELFKIVSI